MERLPISGEGIRVFRGYKKRNLVEKAFLAELQTTFMPGTPLMLRDLGLAAYLPVLVPDTKEADTPDEVAIIAYASNAAYVHARRETVVGRMYTHTHRGVFEMDVSGSEAAAPIATFGPPVTAFSVTGAAVDWQADGDVVILVGERMSANVEDFGRRVLAEMRAPIASSLVGHGVLECVGEVADTWVALWFLCDGFGEDPISRVRSALGESAVPTLVRELMLVQADRLVWVDSPPEPDARRGRAWSYIFQRDGRHFLR